jgi:hypothetical protein
MRIKWSLLKLLENVADLGSSIVMIMFVLSYLEIITFHSLSWWNIFNIYRLVIP